MRRAKIVCTLGPATSTAAQIRALVEAGMDIARLNLSHGTHADHTRLYQRVRAASDASGRAVGILADLQGPKIRTGTFATGPVVLVPGDQFAITTRDVPGDKNTVSTTYAGLAGDVKAGDKILIDDGNVSLVVESVTATDVLTRIEEGGEVSDHKGINLPGVAVSVPALSDKDEDDLRFALKLGVDFVALSFVRSADDLLPVQAIMQQEGIKAPVIAKVEKPQAVENLRSVIEAFDGVMVARGDLGVELPLEEVPLVQKLAVELARREAKPVIVATQVLESMISHSRPTRAEASDVANAVLDGADAIMLSGETSVGAYPIEAVRTMARIIESTEDHGLERIPALGTTPSTKGGSVTAAAAMIGDQVGVRYLITFTQKGTSARRMSRVRPHIPMLAFTPEASTRSQLTMTWGIETFLVPGVKHTDQMSVQVDQVLLADGHAEEGDLVVIVAGSPPGIPGSTNSVRVHKVGDAINRVAAAYEDYE